MVTQNRGPSYYFVLIALTFDDSQRREAVQREVAPVVLAPLSSAESPSVVSGPIMCTPHKVVNSFESAVVLFPSLKSFKSTHPGF